LPASGFLPVDSLPPDRYQFDRGTRTLNGFRSGNQFRMGDEVRIRVISADPDRREIEFALVKKKRKNGSAAKAPKPTRSSKSPSSRTQRSDSPRKHR
jgi:ribonuclease R